MMLFTKAIKDHHFKTIEILANEIWQEHYTSIIGKPQVDYMLEKFQSINAIQHQIKEGYVYFLMETDNSKIGYLSIKKESNNLFLSKLYILKSERGNGFGKKALYFIEEKAKTLGCKTISLTVNKNNTNSIHTYKTIGFKTVTEIVIDIGNGFVMDDYKMVKLLA